jgi:parvulin-like peptidyl-prolyl isomerase
MISVLRRKLVETKFYKIIFWLVIVAMLGLWTLPTRFDKKAGAPESIWAIINGREIYQYDLLRKAADFDQRLQMMRAEYGQYADQFMAAMGINPNPQALAADGLMREVLLDQVATDLAIQIHPEYVQQSLDDIGSIYAEVSDLIPARAIDMKNGGIHVEPLRLHLRNFRLSMSDFDARLEQALKRKLTSSLISNAAYVPRFELESEYNARYLPKTFSIMTIPKSEIYVEVKKEEISDNDIQAFFDRKNRANQAYWVPEKRVVHVWTITPHAYGITAPEEEVTRYYEENKERSFVAEPSRVQVRSILFKAATAADLEAARQKAVEVRQQLVEHPTAFADRAQQLSADTQTASHGGLMKPFARGDANIDRNVERASFLLKNNLDISEPVQVKDGIVLLQLVEKKPKVFKTLADVRKEIVDTLINQKFSKRFVQDMKEVYRDKNEAKLKEIITAKHGSVSEKLITNDNSVLARTAFTIPVNDYAFYVENKVGHVVHVASVQERNLPALDAVRSVVKNDLIEERVASLLHSRVNQARQAAQKQPLSEIAHTYKATVKKVGPVDLDNQEQIKALRKEGLPVDYMLQIEKPGMTEVTADDAHGYVIRLDELASFKEDAFEGKRQSLNDKTARARMMLVTQGFVASLHRNATINLNS